MKSPPGAAVFKDEAELDDKKSADDVKPKIQMSVAEMKRRLISAKVPDDQIVGLLRVHKSALVAESAHEHFIVSSFLILFSLVVASFGFTVVLLGKLSPNKALQPTFGLSASICFSPRSASRCETVSFDSRPLG